MAKSNLYRERSIEATRLHQGTLSETKRRIAKLYEEAAEDLVSLAGRSKSSLTQRWATSYTKEMRSRINELWQDVGQITQGGMAKEAHRGVAIQTGLLGDAADLAHLDLRSRFASTFARTPDEAIAAVIQGKLYSGPKAILSKRIWRNAELQAGKIEEVILQGLAKQQSPVQLAKALQAYVNPKAIQPNNWNDVYENCPFPLRVDYNAKRLAVTSINHAYYSAAILTGRDNPFAVGIQWELSSFHVIYDVCDLYMEHDEGLGLGVYSFDNAPIPHPFCRCNWYVTEGERSLEDIAKELYRWEQGESNPRLDRAFGAWKNIDISQKSGIINTGEQRNMANGLRKPPAMHISDEQVEELKTDIRAIGADENVFEFNAGRQTGYADGTDVIFIRGDVYPDLESTRARDRMSQRAVLAHEYYGHRTYRNTRVPLLAWNDEFRASYRAALDTPNLTDEDRMLLMQDALDRAREAGVTVRITETIRRVLYGY